jgi:hypothetical protein
MGNFLGQTDSTQRNAPNEIRVFYYAPGPKISQAKRYQRPATRPGSRMSIFLFRVSVRRSNGCQVQV